MIVLSSIVFLAAACGSSAAPSAAPASVPVNAAPTEEPAVVPTQDLSSASSAADNSGANSPSGKAEACTVLTKDDVSKVLGAAVDSAAGSGLGGVCTYISKNLSIVFTIAAHSGASESWKTQLARIDDLALVVPELGDQAFYNTNPDGGSPLFLLKDDAEYLFSMSDVNYQPLDPSVVQATEKALAVQLLSQLP